MKQELDIIIKALEQGLLDYNKLEKAHKYLSKVPDGKGGYNYVYKINHLNQTHKDENIEKIKQYGNEVINGTKHIERLSPTEEQGRLLGGRVNVESTILLRGNEITDSTEPERIDELISKQESLLENYSKKEGNWFNEDEISKWSFFGNGEEAKVYYDSVGYLKKVVNYDLFSVSPLEFIDNRISLHNHLFPDTKYELLGFTKNSNGLAFVLKQQYIDGKNTPVENIESKLSKMGFESVGGNTYVNENYILDDLHKRNVLTDKNGELFFIDTVVSLNTEEDGYAGKRKYGEIEMNNIIQKSEIDILIKAFEQNVLDYDKLEKAHKYIKKEFKNGKWEYTYADLESHQSKDITENKKLGHSGKFISKTATNPAQVFKGVDKHLKDIGQKFDYNFANKTSSRYIETEDSIGNKFKIRIANHSPAISDENDWKGIKIDSFGDGTFDTNIDSSIGYNTDDIKNILNIVKQTSEELKGKNIDLKPEDLYGKYTNSSINETVSKVFNKLGIEEDYYGVNKEIVGSLIKDYKYSDEYRNFVKQKEEKQKIEPIQNYTAKLGFTVNKNNSPNQSDWSVGLPDAILGNLWSEYVKENNLSKENDKQKYKKEKEAFKLKLSNEAKIEAQQNKGEVNTTDNIKNIKEHAKRIISGDEQLERLSSAEEQGRNRGGQRNVEATLILTGSDRASTENKGDGLAREHQIDTLTNYAKSEGIWNDSLDKHILDKNSVYIDGGSENEVYHNKDIVYKINNLSGKQTPLEFLDKISLHNYLFPDVAYKVTGFGKDKQGKFSVLLEQPFIKATSITNEEDIKEDMSKRGFNYEKFYSYSNNDYSVSDLKEANVITNNGKLYYIDPFISKNGIKKSDDIYFKNFDELEKAEKKDYGVGKHIEQVQVTNKKTGKTYLRKEVVGHKDNQKPVKEKKHTEEELQGHAKTASQQDLERHIKEGSDETMRKVAHQELERRKNEEHVQEPLSDKKSETDTSADKKAESVSKDKEVQSPYDKDEKQLTEEEIRGQLKVLRQEIDKLSDPIDEEYKDKSIFVRAAKKREIPGYTKLSDEYESLRKKLTEVINNKPKVQKIEEDTGYKMFHRPNEDGALSSDVTEGDIALPKDFYNKPENYGKLSDKTYKESFDILKKIKDNPEAEITIYRATNGNEINDGDWITLSKEYAKIHNQSSLENKGNILELKVKAKDIRFAGDDIREFGYFPNNKDKKEEIKKSEENKIEGGKADNLTITDLAKKHNVSIEVIKKQLNKGIKAEMEHTDDPKIATEIAMDHIFESHEYYDKLEEMEQSFNKEEDK